MRTKLPQYDFMHSHHCFDFLDYCPKKCLHKKCSGMGFNPCRSIRKTIRKMCSLFLYQELLCL